MCCGAHGVGRGRLHLVITGEDGERLQLVRHLLLLRRHARQLLLRHRRLAARHHDGRHLAAAPRAARHRGHALQQQRVRVPVKVLVPAPQLLVVRRQRGRGRGAPGRGGRPRVCAPRRGQRWGRVCGGAALALKYNEINYLTLIQKEVSVLPLPLALLPRARSGAGGRGRGRRSGGCRSAPAAARG